MSKQLFRVQRRFPPALSIIQKPREPIGGVYYYPSKGGERSVVVLTYRKHRYYLVAWRNLPEEVLAIGKAYQQMYPELRYTERLILFYRDPVNKVDPRPRYGLYIRMERKKKGAKP